MVLVKFEKVEICVFEILELLENFCEICINKELVKCR